MGLFSRRAAPRRYRSSADALTASARQISPIPEGEDKAKPRKVSDRQKRAWECYDEIGEVRFAARFMGDAFARLRLFPAVQPDPFADPIPLDPAGDAEAGYTAAEAKLAIEAMDALQSPEGGQAEIQRRIGVNLFVPGEVHLVGRPWGDGERWDAYSTEEIRADSSGDYYLFKDSSGGKKEKLDESAVVLRVWRAHPRWSENPDSPILTALGILEELLLSTRSIQGAQLNRLASAGMLILPSSMREGPLREGESESDGQSVGSDPVTTDLIQVASTAISDPSSAAARVPLVQFMDDELWKTMSGEKLIQWDHDVDSVAAATRSELIQRFAVAIDLPVEVLMGTAGVNHWSMWFIGKDTFNSHIEPAAMVMDSGLATAYLQPLMMLANVADVGRFTVWHDPSALVSDPDPSDVAFKAHEALAISDERLRRDTGYSEEDAPSDEEVTRRVAIEAARAGRTPAALPAGPSNVQQGPPAAAIDIPITAALSNPVERLPGQLAEMDYALLLSVHQMADAAMHRALERANSRLRSLAQRDKSGAAKAMLAQVPSVSLQVAPTLGPAMVATLAADEELISALAFAGMLDRYDVRTSRAAEETILLAQKYGDLSDADAETLRREYDTDRLASRDVLLAGLLAAGSALLFRPEPLGPPGETDGSLVAMGLVRDALSRAGGGGADAVSMLTGARVRSTFGHAGITFARYQWRYGDASARLHAFEPHRRLDGTVFENPSDDRLGNASRGFPRTSHYAPGDHKGCQCLWVWMNPEVADRSTLTRSGVPSPQEDVL